MDLFDVIAQPNRREILDMLCSGDRSVGDLVEELSLPQPTVSKHLRVLRTTGFVSSMPDAQRRVYRLRLDRVLELDEWLQPYRAAWSSRLDALEDHLDHMEDS